MVNDEDDQFFEGRDIRYSEKEIDEFRSIKNIFVNRKQFKHRAMINSPAYKLKQKEIQREKSRFSKNKAKANGGTANQKDGSFIKVVDPSLKDQDDGIVDDDEEMEESDPRLFRVHKKTYRL